MAAMPLTGAPQDSYMFTVNGKTKHPSLRLFVERYRKFPLKVRSPPLPTREKKALAADRRRPD